ncbi:MAG: YraN family protein [Sphaerospermopsis sp. SIO1G2]|nr:YraN family protein [Sphaerospermopsis sp. SIO1G2]
MSTLSRQASYGRGLAAEHAATTYLRQHGYDIMQQRYKTPYGEIDVIARQDTCIVFVEVKARASQEQAMASISPRQARRIMNAASLFMAEQEQVVAEMDMRFDVITMDATGIIMHLPHAWDAHLWEQL